MDLLVAATALAQGIPLFTCNPADFQGLDSLIEIVPVDPEEGGYGREWLSGCR